MKIAVKKHPAKKAGKEKRESDLKEALTDSEVRYRRLFESAKDGILILDAESGMIMDVNPFLIGLLGYPKELFLGKRIWEIGFFMDIAANKEKFLELQKKEYVRYDNLPLETADGRKINIEFVSNVYQVNEKKVIQCNIRDITKRKKAEDAFLESEIRYRAFFENSMDAMLLTSPDGQTLSANQAACRMFGYSEDELISIGRLGVEDVTDPRLSVLLEERKLKGKASGELTFIRKDGTRFPAEISSVLFKNREGFEYTSMIIHDISFRKNSEQEIIMLAHSLKSVNECVSITDLENKILFVNESFLKTYGYGIEELIGKDIKIIGSQNNDEKYVGNILPATILGEWEGELMNRRKDGSEFPVSLSTSVIRDKQNKILGLIGVAKEITERKRAEELLRESEERLRITLEQTQIGTFDWDVKNDLYYVSDTYYTMLGYKPEPGPADRNEWLDRIHPDDKVILTKIINDTLYGNETKYQYETRVKHADGSWRWIYVNGHTVKWNENHKPVRMLGVRIDITERKLAEEALIKAKEQAEESDRLKSAFLANMSHEIRTPMNGILGFTDLLKEPKLTGEQQQEYISIIEKSGVRMLSIINDIVSIAKVESGQTDILISETNVNGQVDFVFNLFKPEAEQKKLQLFYKNSLPDKEAYVKTDREKIFAVLTNLVKNAIKFTAAGSIELGYEKKGQYLEFFVKDTGIGVPEEQKELIFERFRQGSESLSRNYEGAGLGLSISRAYIEMLGGKIWVENNYDSSNSSGSDPGNGSVFYFTIPYNPVNEKNKTRVIDRRANENENHPRNLKTLIAEDDKISLEFISTIARKFSREVIKAVTGREAVEACHVNPDINLVLMDIKMPDTDGYEATRQIRAFNKEVIIIAQTAYGLDGDRIRAIEAGCNDYISKPINQASLTRLIEKYFK